MVRRVLSALLSRVFPGRGRHRSISEDDDTIVWGLPPADGDDDDDEGVSPADMTIFDLPPRRDRPYVQPGDPPEIIP
jgi:hypothetical protein